MLVQSILRLPLVPDGPVVEKNEIIIMSRSLDVT